MTRPYQSPFKSLKFKLMAFITVLLVIIVVIPVLFFVNQLDKSYQEFSINMIETTSQVVYQFIYDGMMTNDSLSIQNNLEVLAMDPSIQLVRLYRPGGHVLYSSRPEEINQNMADLNSDVVFPRDPGKVMETFLKKDNIYSHHHLIHVGKECAPCHTNTGSVIGILDVHAGFTASQQIYENSKNLALFGGLFIVLFLWLSLNFVYQSQIDSRLHLVTDGFEKLSQGQFGVQISMPGKDELTFLAEKFNLMVDNLNRARLQEEQFFQEKLERADRLVTLGEVAAEIAHEVNNPAGIILTRAEFLKQIMEEKKLDSPLVEDLEIIIQQTEKIAETTRSILHYSRKLPQTFSPSDLNEIIRHSVKILEPRINKNKNEVHLELPARPSVVWGNTNQMEQVFCNLINNSLDFVTPHTGKIWIKIQNSKPRHSMKQVRIIYQDNGPGIPPELKDKIFSPFFTTKEKDTGTGLGLFIVKNIISHHRGTISLDEDFTGGARFIIELEAHERKS